MIGMEGDPSEIGGIIDEMNVGHFGRVEEVFCPTGVGGIAPGSVGGVKITSDKNGGGRVFISDMLEP